MSIRHALFPIWTPATVVVSILALLAGFLVTVGAATPAQAAGQQIFDGPNGTVRAVATGADGVTYLGGDFTRWGPQTGGGTALSTINAAVNRTLPPVSGSVYATVPDGVGGWYIGGYFTAVAGQPRSNLAHILPSGALDPAWNPNANSIVYALAVSGTTVYAGGNFTSIGGTGNGAAAQYLAALPAGSLPVAPTAVTATRGNASATVSWTAPTDVGSGITGSRLDTAPGPNYDTWTTRIATTGTTATTATTGLTNATTYLVRVTALAAEGAGGTSLPAQWFQPIATLATPAAPTGLTGTGGNTKITATWNPVTDVGAGATHIIRYRTIALAGTTAVRFCDTTGTQATPPATTCELTSLTNGQTFTLISRSWNNKNKFSDLTTPAGPYTPTP